MLVHASYLTEQVFGARHSEGNSLKYSIAPRKEDDLVALAYMMASLGQRSPLPWDSVYKDILRDGLLTSHAVFETACHRLADAKQSANFKTYCDGLPRLFNQFLVDTLNHASNFSYIQYRRMFYDYALSYLTEKFP